MIARLINQGYPFGEPTYTETAKQIGEMKEKISAQLDDNGKDILEQICNAHLKQCNAVLESAFVEGFCTATDLFTDYLERCRERAVKS